MAEHARQTESPNRHPNRQCATASPGRSRILPARLHRAAVESEPAKPSRRFSNAYCISSAVWANTRNLWRRISVPYRLCPTRVMTCLSQKCRACMQTGDERRDVTIFPETRYATVKLAEHIDIRIVRADGAVGERRAGKRDWTPLRGWVPSMRHFQAVSSTVRVGDS